jgi:hypothetical protein
MSQSSNEGTKRGKGISSMSSSQASKWDLSLPTEVDTPIQAIFPSKAILTRTMPAFAS